MICSASEELKGRFEDINIYLRFRWYRYPIKLQRIVAIILIDNQKSDVFKVIGSLTASRETYKKVRIRELISSDTKHLLYMFFAIEIEFLCAFFCEVINGGFLSIMFLRTILK